ncbi:MAG TPA: acyltransferase, partial [Nitrosospira sp.]|nr:acyltransferase [Nitrosospira sp.]
MERLVRLFRRETTSTEFIPVIDGLRFLAIAMVVLFHADAFIKAKSAGLAFSEGNAWMRGLTDHFVFMGQGVKLFFVISGFILAVPFLRYYLGLSEKKPILRAYFFRRLTRLEPPYIISTILIFLAIVVTVGSTYPLGTLLASLFASLAYIHTLVFPGQFPFPNAVTWSLEIEVQYYILAPFLMWGLCQVKDKVKR